MLNLPAAAFRACDGGALISCRVQPGASRSGIGGAYGDAQVKIALHSPPVDGRANQELVRLLAEISGRPKSSVEIRTGAGGRSKTVMISGVTPAEIKTMMEKF